jgi:RNA polymerase sigma-70 factor (ECF subfamily)
MLRVLLYEYKKTVRLLRKAYRQTEMIKDMAERESNKKIISSMIKDTEFVIDWIRSGREPGKRRGAERVNVYLVDPMMMDSVQYNILGHKKSELSLEDKNLIKKALRTLSDREREVYILHYAELLSLEEIAQLLSVKKSTIQTTLKRAQCKVRKEIETHELCAAHS